MPPPLARRLLTGFDGGLNLRDAPGELQDNESPDMLNVTLDERGGIVKRLGYRRDNSTVIFQDETAPSVLSGNEITDATRATNNQGDARPREPYDFRGGFLNGDALEFTSLQEAVGGRLTFVSSPVPRNGSYCGRFEVRNGDIVSSGERLELVKEGGRAEHGDDYWYGWSTQFPTTFHDIITGTGFKVITQWHDATSIGPPSLAIKAQDGNLGVQYNNGVLDVNGVGTDVSTLTPFHYAFPKGVWIDFLVEVRWRTDATGYINIYTKLSTQTSYTLRFSRSGVPTLQSPGVGAASSSNYFKQGLYRNIFPDTYTDILYHDAFRIGRNRAEMELGMFSPDGTTGIYPAATNRLQNGNVATNVTDWIINGVGTTVVRETSSFVFNDVTRVTVTTPGTNTGEGARHRRTGLAEVGKTYVGSCYAQRAPGQAACIVKCNIVLGYTDLTTDESVTRSYVLGDYPLYLVTNPIVANGAKTVSSVRITVETSGSIQARTFYVGGAQIESDTKIITPYVHTDGAEATRAAARVQYASSAISATQGYVAAKWRFGFDTALGTAASRRHFDWTLDANNYLRCYYDEVALSWKFERKAGGVGTTVTVPFQHVRGAYYTVIAAWTASQIKLSINGAPFVTAADVHVPAGMPANFDLGSDGAGANHICSDVKWVGLSTTTLTDDDAVILGLAEAFPFPNGDVPRNLYYSEALDQLIIQIGPRLYKRTSANSYTQIERAANADAFTTNALAGLADMGGKLYAVHPVDGVLEYSGAGNIAVVNATVKGNSLAAWQNKLWATGGVNNTVWWSNPGTGATWTTAEDFIQVRDVNDDMTTAIGFGQALDAGAIPATGLLVYKRSSTHRISNSATGEYTTLSAEAGAIGPRAVGHLNGLTCSVNDRGVWVTDGTNPPINASAKIEPLFRPSQLNLGVLADNTAVGIYRDRVIISLSRVGVLANTLTLEYRPDGGWFAAHDFGMTAYATLRASDYSLYALDTLDPPNVVKMFVGGADDQDISGDGGNSIACSFRTRWFEPVNGTLSRIRRTRLQHRGAFSFYVLKDFAESNEELVLTTEPDSTLSDAIYGVAIYGVDRYGRSQPSAERYTDVNSLGFAKAWSFVMREESSTAAFGPAHIGTDSPEVGRVALYELHMDFVSLAYA